MYLQKLFHFFANTETETPEFGVYSAQVNPQPE